MRYSTEAEKELIYFILIRGHEGLTSEGDTYQLNSWL